MNHIEKVRDPSHVEAYRLSRWIAWMIEAGFELHHLSRWSRPKTYQTWFERAQQPESVERELEGYILELSPAAKAYLDVEESEDRLVSLSHEAVLLVGEKARVT